LKAFQEFIIIIIIDLIPLKGTLSQREAPDIINLRTGSALEQGPAPTGSGPFIASDRIKRKYEHSNYKNDKTTNLQNSNFQSDLKINSNTKQKY
jgi:hypothetical protein